MESTKVVEQSRAPARAARTGALLLTTALIALLAACGSEDETATTQAQAAAGEAATAAAATTSAATGESTAAGTTPTGEVKLWTLPPDPNKDVYKEIVSTFEEGNPDTKVEWTAKVGQALKDNLGSNLSTSQGPDIVEFFFGVGFSDALAKSNLLLPLDKYFDQYGWEERWPEGVLAGGTTQLEGKRHAVPWIAFPFTFYYSKALFNKAGIEKPPTTYDELIAVMDKLKAAGITPLAVGGKFSWNIQNLADNLTEMTCGSQVFDDLRAMEIKWTDQPCVTEAFTELRRLAQYMPEGFMGLDPEAGEVWNVMLNQQAAMIYAGGWIPGTIKAAGQNPDDYGLFAFPTGTGRVYWGGSLLMIGAKSENPDLAAKVIDTLTSPEVQSKYYGQLGAVSLVEGATPPADLPQLVQDMSSVFSEASGVFTTSTQQLTPPVLNAYFSAGDTVAPGQKDPGEAAGVIQAAVDRETS